MYKITVIENEDELIKALNKNRIKGDESPSISEVDLTFNSDGIFLSCPDGNFDIERVELMPFIRKLLKKHSVNVITEHEVPM